MLLSPGFVSECCGFHSCVAGVVGESDALDHVAWCSLAEVNPCRICWLRRDAFAGKWPSFLDFGSGLESISRALSAGARKHRRVECLERREKKQVIALGQVGWPMRRIEKARESATKQPAAT